MPKQYKGTGVAVITPFKKDGSIDIPALENIIQHLIEGGVNYLVALGTTGESVTLSKKEMLQVIETFIKVNANRVPLVVGAGGNNTSKVIQFINETESLNIDAWLSVAPYYNKPSQEGIYRHYVAIANATEKDIILYNVPPRTSSNIEAGTVLRLANDFENIIGIKEASGDLSQCASIIQDADEDFFVISGDDALALPLLSLGGDGLISVIGNAFPIEVSDMIQLGLDNDVQSASIIYYQLLPFIELIFREGNPTGIKALMSVQEKIQNEIRLPLVKASADLMEELKEELLVFT